MWELFYESVDRDIKVNNKGLNSKMMFFFICIYDITIELGKSFN